jgi:hypothetical protein
MSANKVTSILLKCLNEAAKELGDDEDVMELIKIVDPSVTVSGIIQNGPLKGKLGSICFKIVDVEADREE